MPGLKPGTHNPLIEGRNINGKKTILMAVITVVLAAAMIGGATMAWFTDSDTSEPVTMTAGTLLVEAGTSMIYGIEKATGDIYEIDVSNGKEYLLFDGTTPYGDENYPNGLAYDRQNDRLYYAYSNGALKFYNFKGNENNAGVLRDANNRTITVAGATFGRNHYWYVKNNSADLYRTSFDEQGKILENVCVKENFNDKSYGFGDLALEMKEGIIYGSSVNGEFFTIDTRDGDYTYKRIGTVKIYGGNVGFQLAFAADGKLYGHATHIEDGDNWFRIDIDDSNFGYTRLAWSPGKRHFTDLACNYQNNWNPGDTDKVRYVFENKGTKNMVLRFTPEFTWEPDENNKYYNGEDLNLDNITVSLCTNSSPGYNPNDWREIEGTYYYVGDPLAPGETVALCLKVELDGPGTENEYQGASLTITGTVEAVQASNNAPYYEWKLTGTPDDHLYDYLLD